MVIQALSFRYMCCLTVRLASGSCDNTVCVWNVNSGECDSVLNGHTSTIISLYVLPDGRLASGSCDNTVCVWNVNSGGCDSGLNGHTSTIILLYVLPDGKVGIWIM